MLDFDDYKDAMDKKLQEKFLATDKDLKTKWNVVKDIVKEGVREGCINEEDASVMVPECSKAGRLYGMVKDHKNVLEGSNILP